MKNLHGNIVRVRTGVLALAAGFAIAAAGGASAETIEELAKKAAGEGEIIWYEANSPEMGDKIVEAFQTQFPDLELRFERITGAQGILGRIVQETDAKAPTADVTTTGIDQIYALNERGLTAEIDWPAYGVAAELTPQPYAVAATAATWVILYNTNLVPAADAPKGWDDLTDPKWKGKIGLWAIGHSQANMAAAWGEERTDEFVKKLTAQSPLLYKSNFTIAQNVAAGELSIGIAPLHVAEAAKDKGAPIGIVLADPIPLSMIYSTVLKDSPNPNGARLLVAWLLSKEGAEAYETATGRGNPYLEFTRTAGVLKGQELSTFDPADTGKLQELITKYTEMLRQAGEAR